MEDGGREQRAALCAEGPDGSKTQPVVALSSGPSLPQASDQKKKCEWSFTKPKLMCGFAQVCESAPVWYNSNLFLRFYY